MEDYTGKKKQKVAISNVFYISAKRLQKLNGNDTLRISLPMHSSTDQRLTESPLVKISLINLFRNHFLSTKILCTSVFPPIMLLQKRGECERVQRREYGNTQLKKLCPYSSLPVKSSVCQMWLHWLFWHSLPTAKTLKDRDMCEPALEAGQTWAEKRKKHYLITVWNILSVDPDFTEHLLAAH